MKLKAYKGDIYVPMYGSIADAKVYLKSEADKVIAELKVQKAQAKDDCAYWKMSECNAVNAMHETEEYAMQLYKELRHHKYKRCLAIVQRCKDKLEAIKCVYYEDAEKGIKLRNKWFRRYDKWLALAEKFKEAK